MSTTGYYLGLLLELYADGIISKKTRDTSARKVLRKYYSSDPRKWKGYLRALDE